MPIEVNREYKLPAYADKKTLVLVSSYSGDTEETLSTFLDALKRKCMIYCVTSGGALLKYAKKHKVPLSSGARRHAAPCSVALMLVPLLGLHGESRLS